MADWLLDGTLGLLLLGLAGGALHARQLYAAVLLFIAFGLVLALVWARLGAADLALAEAAIGAGLTGVLLFTALAGQPLEGSEPRLPRRQRLAVAGVLLPLLWLLGDAVAPLADGHSALPVLIAAAVPDSGVSHPVTAVLLNFRAWDTLLELAVLLLALIGARQLGPARLELSRPWPLLQAWGPALAPLLVLAGGYVLWRGAASPGGAFQAGAVLAAGIVLLRLAEALPALGWRHWPLRLAVLGGLLLFVAVAALCAWFGRGWLSYPVGWAKPLILAIEAAATLAIACSLALLVIGDAPEPPR